jgi:hypothetical protein
MAHRRDGGVHGRLGEHRAAEIGVQHRAREVEHRAHARLRVAVEPGQGGGGDLVDADAIEASGARGRARVRQRGPHRRHRGGPAEAVDRRQRGLGLQDVVHGREAPERIGVHRPPQYPSKK